MSPGRDPLYYILITFFLATSVLSSPKFQAIARDDDGNVVNNFDNALKSDSVSVLRDAVNGPSNLPIRMCAYAERGEYADLNTVYLDPPCEPAAQGYCGLRRNQNYTFIAKFLPKTYAKTLSVRVSTADPNYGWETLLWPEFSVCSRFNITCPQDRNDLVEAYLDREVPKGVPPMRAIVRVRLLGMDENYVKKVMICREINIQLF